MEEFPKNENKNILFEDLIEKIKQIPEDKKKLFNLENLEKNEGDHLWIMSDRLLNSIDKLKSDLELRYDRELKNSE